MKLTPENLRIDGKSPGRVTGFTIGHEEATVEYRVTINGREQVRVITVATDSVTFEEG